LDALQVDLLHDCKVEVLEGEEGGDEDSAQANGQHYAHEAAVDHRVDAVAYESKGATFFSEYQVTEHQISDRHFSEF
jgi:hypothetical protein